MLALFLDRHGVATVVFNLEAGSRWHPKGSTHNARTMEHYRRLGLSDAVRGLGLPEDHPRDIAYFTRLAGWELARLRMGTERERARAAQARGKPISSPNHWCARTRCTWSGSCSNTRVRGPTSRCATAGG